MPKQADDNQPRRRMTEQIEHGEFPPAPGDMDYSFEPRCHFRSKLTELLDLAARGSSASSRSIRHHVASATLGQQPQPPFGPLGTWRTSHSPRHLYVDK
jgi:hypothetical protein